MTGASPWTTTLLRLSQAPGVGPALLRKLTASASNMSIAPSDPLELLPERLATDARAAPEWEKSGDFVVAQLEAARIADATVIGLGDPAYPPALLRTADAPPFLFAKGLLLPFVQRSVAVIGTRHPTRHGAATAWRISRYFAEQGCSIVSGLALGCDTLAHGGALEANGHTIAVLAHGLQTIAPRENEAVANAILDGGGTLVTEFPFGTKPAGFRYVQRDKTQAGLSNGVILIQSTVKGGSLHASRAALAYGRWLAVAAPTDQDVAAQAESIGANILLASGSPLEKADLLRTDVRRLASLHILGRKQDYEDLLPLLWQQDRSESMEMFDDHGTYLAGGDI